MSFQQAMSLLRKLKFPSQATRFIYCRATTTTTTTTTTIQSLLPYTSRLKFSFEYSSRFAAQKNTGLWILLCGQAAIFFQVSDNPAFAEDNSVELGTGNDREAISTGLRRIEDGSVISNSHTVKWRLFTDKGRDLFLKGKYEEAENYFLSALQEAKDGFGQRDAHVASSCNNLAELYRVRRAFHMAEPLYLEAINILEESYGLEDIRVGAALHNLGQFYLVQRKLEDARVLYERALKIKGRVLGHGHTEYADTMYHLGTVTYLQGMEKDAMALFEDSIRILEEGGLGESIKCLNRLRHLARISLKSNNFVEAEIVQRKILHIMELSKGWNSLETVVAAESLALTLQSVGKLKEAQEFLERCLDVRKTLLDENHIQIGGNMLHMGTTRMLNSNRLRKVDISEARAELNKAKAFLDDSVRISRRILESSDKKRNNLQNYAMPKETDKDKHAALVILLRSLDAIGLLEIAKREMQEPGGESPLLGEAEYAYRQCITSFKEVIQSGTLNSISSSPEVRAQYLSCLKHLSGLIRESTVDRTKPSKSATLQDLEDEIKQVESQLSLDGKCKT